MLGFYYSRNIRHYLIYTIEFIDYQMELLLFKNIIKIPQICNKLLLIINKHYYLIFYIIKFVAIFYYVFIYSFSHFYICSVMNIHKILQPRIKQ